LARDDDSGFHEFLGDANGPAFQKREERTGPPLSYVAEKLRGSIEGLHELYQNLNRCVPDNLPQPPALKGSSFSTKHDSLVSPAWTSFRYGVVAYLALENMLGLANDNDLFDRLLAMSRDDFRLWLDRIASEGSETG